MNYTQLVPKASPLSTTKCVTPPAQPSSGVIWTCWVVKAGKNAGHTQTRTHSHNDTRREKPVCE